MKTVYIKSLISSDMNNDDRHFDNLLNEYGSLITKICYYFARNGEEFKDLRQEILVNIWKGIDKFRKEARLSTWIYRVCFNTCITYTRKNKRRPSIVPIEYASDIPHDDTTDMRLLNELHNLILQLNDIDRAIILMWLDEKNYDEISLIMGMNRNTVAVRIKRIKEKLVTLSNQ